jgi:hypothetical protein
MFRAEKLGNGAGDRIRTGDINLGKVALYQLSYSREGNCISPRGERPSLSRDALRAVKFRASYQTACIGRTAARNSHIHEALPNVHIDATALFQSFRTHRVSAKPFKAME